MLLRCLGRHVASGGSGHVPTGGVRGARMCGVVQGHCLSPEGAQGPHRSCKICRGGGHSCLSTRAKLQCEPTARAAPVCGCGAQAQVCHQLVYLQLCVTLGTVSLHVWVLC